MVDAIVTGANGSLGTAISRELSDRGLSVFAVARRPGGIPTADGEIVIHADNSPDYSLISAQAASASLLFTCTGLFKVSPFVETTSREIQDQVYANLVAPMEAVRAFLGVSDSGRRRDVVLIGSTSSYSGFENTVVYCAAKHGLRGMALALNDEYRDSDTRFWLASMGSIANEMGGLVPGIDLSTCLDPSRVAKAVVARILDADCEFEPEFTIRRRHV